MSVFAPRRHSFFHGCTVTDWVFPRFSFVVGITTQLTTSPRFTAPAAVRRMVMLRRMTPLVGVGLLLNAWPFCEKSSVARPVWLPPVLGHLVAWAADLRVMGVLQRSALAFGLALLSRRSSSHTVLAVIVGILLRTGPH